MYYENNGAYNSRNQFSGKRNNRQEQPYKRRSMCKLIQKDNVSYISGWKYGSKAGFRTFFVSPAKVASIFTSKSGKRWVTCKVSVTNKTHGSNGLFPAFWNEATNLVICKSLNLIINPNTGFISYGERKQKQTYNRK